MATQANPLICSQAVADDSRSPIVRAYMRRLNEAVLSQIELHFSPVRMIIDIDLLKALSVLTRSSSEMQVNDASARRRRRGINRVHPLLRRSACAFFAHTPC